MAAHIGTMDAPPIPDRAIRVTDDATRAVYGSLERLALAAGMLLMAAIVVASLLIAGRTGRDVADAAAVQRVRASTVELSESVLSAETGQRGFLLTGRMEYLASYSLAVQRARGLLDKLAVDLAGNPDMPRWREAILDKLRELAETVELQTAGRHDEALALVDSDRGRRDMQIARDIADRLTKEQAEIVAADLARSEAGARLLVAIGASAFMVLILLAGFVGRSLRRTVRALRRSQTALGAALAALQAGSGRLEAAVAERTAALTDANAELQRFAYIVGHDLRAPLLNIIGFSAELQNATDRLNRFVVDHLQPAGIIVPADVHEASDKDLPEAIRFIQTSTAKMDRLITAILRLSREGGRVLAPEYLDMTGLLGGVIDSVRHLANSAGAKLVVQAAPGLVSDRLAIEQVFSNLAENALKYLAKGRPGLITLSGRREGSWICYEVADNGRGIAERDLDRIFELFRRAGIQDVAGEGIGLAHVRALLRRLGGTVVCESTLGMGSTFIIRLPHAPAPSGET